MLPFVLLAFAITWVCQLPFLLARAGVAVPVGMILPPLAVGALGPALAALALTPRGRRRALVNLGARGNATLIALALAVHPALMIVAALFTHSRSWIGLDLRGTTIGIALLSPVGEELGWRAYLLPRLDPESRPLAASVIVGVVWCAWHIPFDGWPAPSLWLWFVAFSVIVTQLWRASGRCLAVAVAAHLGIHLTRIFRVGEGAPPVAVALLTAAVAVAALRVLPARPIERPIDRQIDR